MESFCPLIEDRNGLLVYEIQIRREIFIGDSRQYSVIFWHVSLRKSIVGGREERGGGRSRANVLLGGNKFYKASRFIW